MASQNQPKYSSLDFFISEELKQTFINECACVGLDVKRVHCFSADPSIREYLSILIERGRKYAPQVFKVLSMLQKKPSIRIEVAANRKIIDLRGVSPEDAVKLIQAAESIRITDAKSVGTSNADSTSVDHTL